MAKVTQTGILWSSVQVTHALPLKPSARNCADGFSYAPSTCMHLALALSRPTSAGDPTAEVKVWIASIEPTMAAVEHNVLTMTHKTVNGDAINSQLEKPKGEGLGSRIAARFAVIGLEAPLPELHMEIGLYVPSWHPSAPEVAVKVK